MIVTARVLTVLLIVVSLVFLVSSVSQGDGLTAVDTQVWRWFVAHRTAAVTATAVVITQLGSTAVLGVASMVAMLWSARLPGRRGGALLIAVDAAGTGLLIGGSKALVARSRPPEQLRLVIEAAPSFPSGHALGSMAVLGVLGSVLIPRLHRVGWRAVAWAAIGLCLVAVGSSRLYLGVHWATDVAAGWLIGAGWWLTCLTGRQVWRRLDRRRGPALRSGPKSVAGPGPEREADGAEHLPRPEPGPPRPRPGGSGDRSSTD